MPKENINGDAGIQSRAEVSWSSEGVIAGTVKISTTMLVDPVEGDKAPAYDGRDVYLDRAGCNRLIRALRKARDGAYGADA